MTGTWALREFLEDPINLVGIESAGLTSSPAIGKYVAAKVDAIA
jgi:L-2-hydroxyglutarate oxidase LhgO